MDNIVELDAESMREMINIGESYQLLKEAEEKLYHSYGGSMAFENRGENEYLIRRQYKSSTRQSLGRRNEKTEAQLKAFIDGKEKISHRIKSLKEKIGKRSPILRAKALGRVPLIAAKIIRKLDNMNWMGKSLFVVGTHALFAYEAKAGLRIEEGFLTTEDIDFFMKSISTLTISTPEKNKKNQTSLVKILQSIDRSFERLKKRTFSASNDNGYIVDLIESKTHEKMMREGGGRFSHDPDDLLPVNIENSYWINDIPKFEAIAIDEKGFPLRMVTIDPRVYALHKQWIHEFSTMRDPRKRRKDGEQAQLVARIATHHLGLSFDDPALKAIPGHILELASRFHLEKNASPFDCPD